MSGTGKSYVPLRDGYGYQVLSNPRPRQMMKRDFDLNKVPLVDHDGDENYGTKSPNHSEVALSYTRNFDNYKSPGAESGPHIHSNNHSFMPNFSINITVQPQPARQSTVTDRQKENERDLFGQLSTTINVASSSNMGAPDSQANKIRKLAHDQSFGGSRVAIAQHAEGRHSPSKELRAEYMCPLCMDKMMDPSATKCGHIFCNKCIDRALTTNRKCPTCRRRFRGLAYSRVYLPDIFMVPNERR